MAIGPHLASNRRRSAFSTQGTLPRGKRCKHKHRYNRRIDGGSGEPGFCKAPRAATDHDQLANKAAKGSGKDKQKGASKNKQKGAGKWGAKR